jgi:hypothetical protein
MEQTGFDFAMTDEERKLLSCLLRGKANARKVPALAVLTDASEVRVREVVRHLIMDHGILIASSVGAPAGFYIAVTPEEIREATRSLRHRGIAILARAAKLQRSSIEDIFKQSRMEFDGPTAD